MDNNYELMYAQLVTDIKEEGYRDICAICKHFDSVPEDCDLECEDCKKPCTCSSCRDCNKWEWRGER